MAGWVQSLSVHLGIRNACAYILFISIPSACHYGAEVLYNGFA